MSFKPSFKKFQTKTLQARAKNLPSVITSLKADFENKKIDLSEKHQATFKAHISNTERELACIKEELASR